MTRLAIFVLSAFLSSGSTALAQWSVFEFGPGTQLTGVHGSQQVGGSLSGASLWTGSPASLIALGAAQVYATDGVQQVGKSSANHAVMWSGSAASLVDLHPDFYAVSTATGVDGNFQCGSASHSLSTYACLWSGTADSVVFLQAPSSTTTTVALDIHADQVVGYYKSLFTSTNHACLWINQAGGIDLHPAGATASEASAVHSGKQAGWATIGFQRAAMWTGSAASHVDLHPLTATQSRVRGIHGAIQVGEAQIAGEAHASLWKESAASWVDLHAFLPVGTSFSVASDVWVDDNGVVYVAGYSSNGGVLWIDSTNAIRTICRGDGSVQACPCNNDAPTGTDSGCLSSLGVGAQLTASGSSSLALDQLVLSGSAMPATSTVLYIQGSAQTATALGDGLRCAGGALIRLGVQQNSAGTSSYPAVGDAPVSVRGQVTAPGVTRSYQAWYRDNTNFCTAAPYNLSNGVSVSWTP